MLLSKIKGIGVQSATVILKHFTLVQLASGVTRDQIAELVMTSKRVGYRVADHINNLLSKWMTVDIR